jgi:lipopolysaccharide/colanic/teichoic acid biosynthesis glycosyltransferase
MAKFRTMKIDTPQIATHLMKDPGAYLIPGGGFLRKSSLDELPQLFNVLKGEMSIVGPRPEVQKYVNLYTEEQKAILMQKPGITDYSSIVYRKENEILSKSDNPEDHYVRDIMPEKLKLNLEFIKDQKLTEYFKLIFLTVFSIIGIYGKNKEGD